MRRGWSGGVDAVAGGRHAEQVQFPKEERGAQAEPREVSRLLSTRSRNQERHRQGEGLPQKQWPEGQGHLAEVEAWAGVAATSDEECPCARLRSAYWKHLWSTSLHRHGQVWPSTPIS